MRRRFNKENQDILSEDGETAARQATRDRDAHTSGFAAPGCTVEGMLAPGLEHCYLLSFRSPAPGVLNTRS